jgi:hypothetical protein
MDNVINSIPNLQTENIGSKQKPHCVIKGFIELPCWEGYYLNDYPDFPKLSGAPADFDFQDYIGPESISWQGC